MEERKQPKDKQPLEPVSEDQSAQIAGGDGCTTTVTVGVPGNNITSTGPSPSDVLTGVYEGAVDATSHVIERVADALKNT